MSRRFSTVLIANRGEIACRVIRTARAEGYRTVAVYSDADLGALHVEMADEAVRLGPAPVAESYLDAERVIAAAHAANADAIHPGYGFLSENASFAEACAEADITFIGPPPKAISEMGDKAEAKRIMLEAGVPCVPGYGGEVQDDATLKSEAAKIGFPVLLKATAGGGGRGMRRVDDEKGFDEALVGARSEAMKAFGSDSLIIEKMIEDVRHVEIQVLADEHGTCIHLGERDCSVQRRHQKVVEESPCPVMTPELREAMGAAAVKAAQAAGYVNAGTVEFLLNDDGTFYFLEMNTRLQVEHPVTELVTGLDLVALQLWVAQGEALPIAQEDIETEGHAIEVRLYAEDPAQGFAPQTGTVHAWHPATGSGIRVDHGLRDGTVITPYYDAMVAKIIAWGANRDEALARLVNALRETSLLGVRCNEALLHDILLHPDFVAGNAKTTFLETSGVLDAVPAAPDSKRLLVAAAAFIERDARPVPASLRGWRSTGPATIPIKLLCDDEVYSLTVSMQGTRYELVTEDEKVTLEVESSEDGRFAFHSDTRHEQARIAMDGDELFIDLAGRTDRFVDVTYAPPSKGSAVGDGVLKAPMVGQIVRVNVSVGDRVSKDDVLVVLEAMKMENQVVAPHDGEVESISVSVGDQVDANQVLLAMTSEESDAE